jgi:hypothetical protein
VDKDGDKRSGTCRIRVISLCVCMYVCVVCCVCVCVCVCVCSGDGQNNGNTRQCKNTTVLAALKEHWLYLPLFFCLFALFSASVIALQIVFSNSSYESSAQWETCQIFKEGRLLVSV